jgi:hypothetical protein
LSGDLLAEHVLALAPLRIAEYAASPAGRPTDADLERARGYVDRLARGADALLYRSTDPSEVRKKGTPAEMANMVVDAVAVLAFQPGGVRIFGQRFYAPGDVEAARWARQEAGDA